MRDPIAHFRAYASTCDAIQRRIIEVDNEPYERKALRGFALRDACRMLGCNEAQLRERPGAEPLFRPGGRLSVEEIGALGVSDAAHRGPAQLRPPLNNMCVLSVANFKGGAGKSTTAVHLAQYLALRGFRTLLVDLDSQATATASFGFAPDLDFGPEQTLWSYLRGDVDSLQPLLVPTHWPRLHLIPANLGLYQAEFELPARQLGSRDFKFWSLLTIGLEQLKDRHDVVICDCPPSLGYLSLNAVYAAKGMLVPCPASMVDFASTGRFFAMVADALEAIANAEGGAPQGYMFLRLLITRFSPADRNQQTLANFLEASFPEQILKNRMVQSTALDLAGNVKRTLYELDPSVGRTLERAVEHLDAVNREIEALIFEHDRVRAAEPARAA